MVMVQTTKQAMGEKPVVVIIETGRPVVLTEIEPSADAILISFKVQHQALLDIISGKAEPSALLPMQMPADMKTVEEQLVNKAVRLTEEVWQLQKSMLSKLQFRQP